MPKKQEVTGIHPLSVSPLTRARQKCIFKEVLISKLLLQSVMDT